MIKNIKTIFVKKLFEIKSSYSVNINLDFNPDEMIVKKIDFRSEDAKGEIMVLIRSDIVNDYIGYTRKLPVNISNELQTRYKITNPIQGTYTFTAHKFDDTYENLAGELVICLEFIEYEK